MERTEMWLMYATAQSQGGQRPNILRMVPKISFKLLHILARKGLLLRWMEPNCGSMCNSLLVPEVAAAALLLLPLLLLLLLLLLPPPL